MNQEKHILPLVRQLKPSVFVLLFMLIVVAASGQSFVTGGTGYFTAGVVGTDQSNLTAYLSETGLLPDDSRSRSAAVIIGGGGSFLIAQRWVLSADGYHAFYPSFGADHVASLSGGGANIHAGYALLNRNRWMLTPAVGIGFMGYRLEITNQGEGELGFGNSRIPAGASGSYLVTNPVVDLRISTARLMTGNGKGFLLGADIGYIFSLQNRAWKNQDAGQDVNGIPYAGNGGFYLKLNLGIGRFRMN